MKWSEWSSWRTSSKWAKQTMKNEGMTQSSMKVPNFAPHFWPSSIEIRFNFNYLMCWMSSCWIFHSLLARLWGKVGDDASRQTFELDCEITLVRAQRLSQFIEQQSRRSDNFTAYSLHPTTAAPPTINMSSAYLACVLLMVLLSIIGVESYSVPNSPVSKIIQNNNMSTIISEWLTRTE